MIRIDDCGSSNQKDYFLARHEKGIDNGKVEAYCRCAVEVNGYPTSLRLPANSRLSFPINRFPERRCFMSQSTVSAQPGALFVNGDRRIALIVSLIASDLRRLPSATTLSKVVNLSTSRFYELFKVQTGISPASYIKSQRMEAAAKLLMGSLKSVKEVAAEVGFNDQSHFVRGFKRRYEITPTTYRKRFYPTSACEMKASLRRTSENWPTNRKNSQSKSLAS